MTRPRTAAQRVDHDAPDRHRRERAPAPVTSGPSRSCLFAVVIRRRRRGIRDDPKRGGARPVVRRSIEGPPKPRLQGAITGIAGRDVGAVIHQTRWPSPVISADHLAQRIRIHQGANAPGAVPFAAQRSRSPRRRGNRVRRRAPRTRRTARRPRLSSHTSQGTGKTATWLTRPRRARGVRAAEVVRPDHVGGNGRDVFGTRGAPRKLCGGSFGQGSGARSPP